MKISGGIYLFLLCCFLCIIVAISCKEQVAEPAEEVPQQEILNPDKPNANTLITSQTIGFDSIGGNSIHAIIDAGDGGFYFYGVLNGYVVIGKLDQQGALVWTRRQPQIADILRIPAQSGSLTNALLAVGWEDVSAARSEARIIIIDKDGNLLTEETYRDTAKSVWFNTVTLAATGQSGYVLVAGGGFHKLVWPIYPYTARFTVTSGGVIIREYDKYYETMPGSTFAGLVNDPGMQYIYAAGNFRLNDSTYRNIVAVRLGDSLGIDWKTDIYSASGLVVDGYAGLLTLSGDRLYVTGEVEVDKTPHPSGGGYWNGGFVAAVDLSGNVLWTTTCNMSQHGDRFYSAVVQDGYLYAVGQSASYAKTVSHDHFGYGCIVKLDPATGGVLWSMHMGSDRYQSGFNSIVVRGPRAYCGGWTMDEMVGSGGRYWFAEVDISGPLPKVTSPLLLKTCEKDAVCELNNSRSIVRTIPR